MGIVTYMRVQKGLVDILLQLQGTLHGLQSAPPLITFWFLQRKKKVSYSRLNGHYIKPNKGQRFLENAATCGRCVLLAVQTLTSCRKMRPPRLFWKHSSFSACSFSSSLFSLKK
uniref:Uncharacterized protein n=1 Tax=Gasterosteus aculeatus aculeatus TaxID=481459 RepID=A0AAQ4NZI2_GASAC